MEGEGYIEGENCVRDTHTHTYTCVCVCVYVSVCFLNVCILLTHACVVFLRELVYF